MIPRRLYQWVSENSKQWTEFNRHFRENVVIFSRGVALSGSSQIRKIAGCTPGRAESQRRRLQRFVQRPIEMSLFFKVWTRTVWRALGKPMLVLAVDETKVKAVFGIMVVGAVFKGRCIPLAWRAYRANQQAAYPPEGQVGVILDLLHAIAAGLPTQAQVRVLADRGIGTSPKLMSGIMALGWTFLFRVTKQSKIIVPDGQAVTFYDQVHAPGDSYQASGIVFKRRGRIPAHVRVLWGQGAQERWALVTNDPSLTGWEYAQRMWIEEAFRDLKSHGWQLEQTLFTCPARLERLWILLVVAYTWLLLWGHRVVTAEHGVPAKRSPDGTLLRRWSLFREGWYAFQRYLLLAPT